MRFMIISYLHNCLIHFNCIRKSEKIIYATAEMYKTPESKPVVLEDYGVSRALPAGTMCQNLETFLEAEMESGTGSLIDPLLRSGYKDLPPLS